MQPLRPFQVEALHALSQHTDVLCVAPTGAGKSRVFFEYLKRQSNARAILFSPLVALNRQHEQNLARAQISAGPRGSDSRVWILSPETLQVPGGADRVARHEPDLIIVDEAHTLWEWGRSFRPAFLKIGELVTHCPRAKTLWLSATLSGAARAEILNLLPEGRRERAQECGSAGIPRSLKIRVENLPWRERIPRVFSFIQTQAADTPGVIFCPTRALTIQLSQTLHGRLPQRNVAAYHAGLSREERVGLETRLRDRELGVLCATTAFGMGIDLDLLRWCIVWSPPSTLLSLVQQIGRVTRSAKSSEALLLWSENDLIHLRCRHPDDSEAIAPLAAFYRSGAPPRATLERLLRG